MELTTHINNDWQVEVRRLLAQPLVAGRGAYREGRMVGVRIAPHPRDGETRVDLLVSIFPCNLAPPAGTETAEDHGALAAFVEGLRDVDYHIRLAACEALGRLGDPDARSDLQATARHDVNRHVRAAAAQALAALDTPRRRDEEVADLQLVLWQQVQHLATQFAVT